MFAIIGLGSSFCTGSPSSVVQQEVAGKFGQYVHSAPSADIGVGSFHCSSPPTRLVYLSNGAATL